jgi:hypothetical protein
MSGDQNAGSIKRRLMLAALSKQPRDMPKGTTHVRLGGWYRVDDAGRVFRWDGIEWVRSTIHPRDSSLRRAISLPPRPRKYQYSKKE